MAHQFCLILRVLNILHPDGVGRRLPNLLGVYDLPLVFLLIIRVFIVDMCVDCCQRPIPFATLTTELLTTTLRGILLFGGFGVFSFEYRLLYFFGRHTEKFIRVIIIK